MARDLEKIEDRISVGYRNGPYTAAWVVYHWTTDGPWVIATFPREDEAWGVVSMILEQVQVWGRDEERAITTALDIYHTLQAGEDEAQQHAAWAGEFGHDLDDDSAARQDHAAEMGVRA